MLRINEANMEVLFKEGKNFKLAENINSTLSYLLRILSAH